MNKYLCFSIIAACISAGTYIRYFDALTYLQNNDSVFYTLGELFVTSFIAPILALCLFTTFEKLNIGQVKFINKIASTTFGVYLIHDSMIGRQVFWYSIFKVDSFQYNQMLFPLYAIITIVLVFSICSLIDYCRIRFVEPSITRCENILIGKLTI